MNANTESLISPAVVKAVRGQQDFFDRGQHRLMTQPLGDAIVRLARKNGAVQNLSDELNGRYFASYFDKQGRLHYSCCSNRHKAMPKVGSCVRSNWGRLNKQYVKIPGVGTFVEGKTGWEVLINLLAEKPMKEQMKPVRRAA